MVNLILKKKEETGGNLTNIGWYVSGTKVHIERRIAAAQASIV